MDKNKLIIGGSLFVTALIIFCVWNATQNIPEATGDIEVPAVVMEDGVQYINITARGGYFPRTLTAEAGVPTILNIETQNTFDCSRALTIPARAVSEVLPQSGVTSFDLGVPEAGALQGLCSMGMYGFTVTFE